MSRGLIVGVDTTADLVAVDTKNDDIEPNSIRLFIYYRVSTALVRDREAHLIAARVQF